MTDQYVTHAQLAAFADANGLEVPADFGPGDPAAEGGEASNDGPLPEGHSAWKDWAQMGGSATYAVRPPHPHFKQPATRAEGVQRAKDAAAKIEELRVSKGFTGRVPSRQQEAREQEEALFNDPVTQSDYWAATTDITYANKIRGWT